jgi:galactitol-specific phosphotransferase system IIB component
MYPRKQLAEVIENIITTEEVEAEIEAAIVEDYKKLNDKCDIVISKIKSRKGKNKGKNKKVTKQIGE